MYFIMEKGQGNCAELILKRNGIFASAETKVVLLRDMLIKMIENIYLLVHEAKYVWWDLKLVIQYTTLNQIRIQIK